MKFLTTSESLIKKLSTSEQAWNDFFYRYSKQIYNIGKFKGLLDTEAEDLVQLVMIKFYKKIQSGFVFDSSIAKFRTFFSRIIRDCIYDIYSKRKNEPDMVMLDFDIEDSNSKADIFDAIFLENWRQIIKNEALEILKQRVDTITFQIFDLYCLQNCQVKDVATFFNVKANNIYVIKNRCLKIINGIIKDLNNDDKELYLDEF